LSRLARLCDPAAVPGVVACQCCPGRDLPQHPSLILRPLATCAIGLPVSRTSRTAPSLKS